MILRPIQKALENLYCLHSDFNVSDFAIPTPGVREKLIVRESPQHLDLALLIGPEILQTLERHSPWEHLGEANLDSFCVAVEGVSHILYLSAAAREERPVSQLEIEIQAEIDKYLLVTFLLRQQKQDYGSLMPQLFENFSLSSGMFPSQEARYVLANRFAQKFCAFLETEFIRHKKWGEALLRARRFYRLNHWNKLRRLQR